MATLNANHTSELCGFGVTELSRLYRDRELSPVELVKATLNRIEHFNPELNAYLSVLSESALASARAAELQFAAGIDLGPLHGVPVSVKDLINVKGTRTTAASKVLINAQVDAEDAPVVRKLRAAGAILIGKTNLHEFAFGDPDPEGPFGVVQNPRKVGHQAGSSSSGSAAAVAAGLGVLSIGTDTGGSIRHPAGACGVVGLKPTYGLVPIRGIIPFSVHLDHVGPLGRSITDVAAGLTAIAGHDPGDPYSVLAPVPEYTGAPGSDIKGLRLGLPTNSCYRFGQPEALAILEQACSTLGELGMAPIGLELPWGDEIYDISNIIMAVDLLQSHQHYQDSEELYGRDFRDRLKRGNEISAVQYSEARKMQVEIRRHWLALFDSIDILALPANVGGAPPHGEKTVEINGKHCPTRVVLSPFNRAASITGFPALTLPTGLTSQGLPIGIQLVGPPFSESRLLAAGHALEQALGNLTERWGIEPRRG